MSNDLVGKVASSIARDVYKDVAQPAARKVGLSLEALVAVALSPVDAMAWGFEKSKAWLKAKIESRLANTPSEYLVQPKANIAYPALSHISLSGDTPELRELYAELLLKAMDARTSDSVHPAYFSIVEQLAAQEALVLVGLHELKRDILFSEELTPYSYPFDKDTKTSVEDQFIAFCAAALGRETDRSKVWLVNLCRLNLLSLQTTSEAFYRPEEYDKEGVRPPQVDNHEYRSLLFTDFGKAFIGACSPAEAVEIA